MPDELPLLRAYTDPSYPLVKCYNLEGAIREARQERVWMKSGAYLVIQPTEALTVIDVNSGKCLKRILISGDQPGGSKGSSPPDPAPQYFRYHYY